MPQKGPLRRLFERKQPKQQNGESAAKKPIEFEKRKRANTGCLRGVLYFVLILVVSLFLAVFAWNCANDVLALSKSDKPVTVTIAEGYTISELSRNLKELGVIENSWLFTLYCNFSDAEEDIEPGTFEVNAKLDYHALVHSFVNRVERTTVQVKITEGKTLRETLRLIADQGVSNYETLLAAVATAELTDYPFLDEIPMNENRLEGYLYPDTYIFYSDSPPAAVFDKFLDNFDLKLTRTMRQQLEQIEYSLNEILTIASLIQMEAATISEMKNISSVIYNRLNSERYPRLELDATGVYIIGRDGGELTPEQIYASRSIDNPYNTFMYEGLPPGPICSPSLDAISAALYPGNTDYYFYALGKDGVHHFFETESGFNNFINSSQFANN